MKEDGGGLVHAASAQQRYPSSRERLAEERRGEERGGGGLVGVERCRAGRDDGLDVGGSGGLAGPRYS